METDSFSLLKINGFSVSSCGTKHSARQVNTDQILLFEHAFEFCAPINISSVSRRTLGTSSLAHTSSPGRCSACEALELIRHAQVCLMNWAGTAPCSAGTAREGGQREFKGPALRLWPVSCWFYAPPAEGSRSCHPNADTTGASLVFDRGHFTSGCFRP